MSLSQSLAPASLSPLTKAVRAISCASLKACSLAGRTSHDGKRDNSGGGTKDEARDQPVLIRNPALEGVLSEREWQVLGLRANGGEYKEIAADLSISASTVKNHISSIHKKLRVHNIAEAIQQAYLGRF